MKKKKYLITWKFKMKRKKTKMEKVIPNMIMLKYVIQIITR